MNKQSRDYQAGMTNVFNAANRSAEVNIKRHLADLEKLQSKSDEEKPSEISEKEKEEEKEEEDEIPTEE